MSITYKIHPDHPEPYKISKVAEALAKGALLVYPTDTVYALGCDPHHKQAVERLRRVQAKQNRHLTLLCPSLARIANYAHLTDAAFKFIKALTPGPYTFILQATKELPKLVLNPKHKTTGLRIPDHKICQALLAENECLLVSTSAKLPSGDDPESREELLAGLAKVADVIIDDDSSLRFDPSTVIDLTTPEFEIVREGLGLQALAPFMI